VIGADLAAKGVAGLFTSIIHKESFTFDSGSLSFRQSSKDGNAPMTAQKTVAALAALAHEHRLAAFRLLVEAGPEGMPAGEVSDRLNVPPSSLTFHLQQLLRAELVTQRRLSRQLIYAANFEAMNTLIGYLTENCCGQSSGEPCIAVVCKPAVRSVKGRTQPRRRSA
jgi:ArsR family transcriptional regulator, arsenate/arsenite/antimonite-responsive transcriptional repressor